MASRRLNVAACVAGVSAGLAPYLPTVVCPGVACTSCFACFGAGGAAASALVVGFVTRRLGRGASGDDTTPTPSPEGGRRES
jgi:hypothetical protein